MAGLWKENLLADLCWWIPRADWRTHASSAATAPRRFGPTFSWASRETCSLIHFRLDGDSEMAALDAAEYIDSSCTVDGRNPYGRVVQAWIKLRGTLIPGGIAPSKSAAGLYFFHFTEPGDQRALVRRASDAVIAADDKLHAFLPLASPPSPRDRDCHGPSTELAAATATSLAIAGIGVDGRLPGRARAWLFRIGLRAHSPFDGAGVQDVVYLILGRSPGNPDAYERLGLAWMPASSSSASLANESVETVTIV